MAPSIFWKHLFVQGSCTEAQDSDAESQHNLPVDKKNTLTSSNSVQGLVLPINLKLQSAMLWNISYTCI